MGAVEPTQDPIRVLLFAGGGFGTSMQLGVTHALLVSRGKAPDMVVGVSAGAINAAVLAEVLQAGGDLEDGEERLQVQVARFREIFSLAQRLPGELFSAFTPNSFQIDTHRPLEPLELPIHSDTERKSRGEALASTSGLMAVVNHLLDLRLPVGTIVRGLRRYLGWRAAAESPGEIRHGVQLAETLHLLLLAAPNLVRLAPLAWQLVRAALPFGRKPPEGGSAGELIFRSRALNRLARLVRQALMTALLIPIWLVLAVFVASRALVVLVPMCFARPLPRLAALLEAWRRSDPPAVAAARERLRRLGEEILGFGAVWLRLLLWVAIWLAVLAAAVLGLRWLAVEAGLRAGAIWIVVGILVLVAVVAVVLVWRRRQTLAQRFFARYRVAKSLFHNHPLRQIFIELFDREYFATVGETGSMDEIVARALDPAQHEPRATEGAPASEPKRIGSYRAASPPIHVGIVAADLATGESEVLGEDVPVVDALLAATAVSPIFPPQEVKVKGKTRPFIDGVNIANEPTRPALTFLRERAGELPVDAPAVHLYPVSSLPISLAELKADTPAAGADDRSLLQVVQRALELQRFRDATLERRLTELYSRAIPLEHRGFAYETPEKTYLRAWVYPIEPERPVTVNQDLVRASNDAERRGIIARTVADGCRAAMEAMIRQDAVAVAADKKTVACRAAVAHRLGKDPGSAGLTGSDETGGPGVNEVCRHCGLHRGTDHSIDATLQVVARGGESPRWPRHDEGAVAADARPVRSGDSAKQRVETALRKYKESARFDEAPWPRERNGRPGEDRPTVNLLFGGGVFRGVYQVGVVNALSEVGLEPDVVAGASVGAITAAMAANVFAERAHGPARAEAVRRLAATYLAIDRLILTDRFSDFVRTLTVRGAQTSFSFRDVDRAFRRFDNGRADGFDRVVRKVVAGVERLVWISPFELLDLMKAFRLQDSNRIEQMLRSYFQEILDRSGVGGEILGTEPLQLLIRQHVLRGLEASAERAQFDAFLAPSGILFLATATNLDRGRLEILGERQLAGGEGAVSLLQGLLASSAFPAVFRPRLAWEVMPQANTEDRLADGGVMDNLPLDAVAQHLMRASEVGLVRPRPGVPHLLFAASLEPDAGDLTKEQAGDLTEEQAEERGLEQAKEMAESWPRVLGRSRQLGYNQKLGVYENAQTAMRRIYEKSQKDGTRTDADFEPLDLEVVTVRPKWLCGTFAFHPMLGFRRRDQARSIAHGCATTLHRLAKVDDRYREGWGIDAEKLPRLRDNGSWTRISSQQASEKGWCWYRPEVPCPFSRVATESSRLPDITRDQLSLIHGECGKPESHEAKASGKVRSK